MTDQPREVEVKFVPRGSVQVKLLAKVRYGSDEAAIAVTNAVFGSTQNLTRTGEQSIVDTYYDSDDEVFARCHGCFRLRKKGDKLETTMKRLKGMSLGTHDRDEQTIPIKKDDVAGNEASGWLNWLRNDSHYADWATDVLTASKKLSAAVFVENERVVYAFEFNNSKFELSFDSFTATDVVNGYTSRRHHEIEIEAKNDAAVKHLIEHKAEVLARLSGDFVPSNQSKYELARLLVGRGQPAWLRWIGTSMSGRAVTIWGIVLGALSLVVGIWGVFTTNQLQAFLMIVVNVAVISVVTIFLLVARRCTPLR